MSNQNQKKPAFPAQHQNKQPGIEAEMNPRPVSVSPEYKASGKLAGKTAIITGGDSGIGGLRLSFCQRRSGCGHCLLGRAW